MKQLKVITSDPVVENTEIKDIKTIFDVPKGAKQIDANTFKWKGNHLRFKKDGNIDKRCLVVKNPDLPKGGRPRLDKVAERMATRNGVIDLSWEQLQKVLKDDKYDDKVKVMIALRMAEKTIPQQIDITSGGQPLILPAEIMDKNNL
jgi:hypothetical protein